MITRSRAAIAAFFMAVLGVSIVHNRRLYGPDQWDLVIRKSFLDMAFVCLFTLLLPIMLIGWSGAFLTEHIVVRTWNNRYWVVSVAVLVGMALAAISSFCFEAVALLSVLPINIISGKIWQKYKNSVSAMTSY
jgi:hypothetical protein